MTHFQNRSRVSDCTAILEGDFSVINNHEATYDSHLRPQNINPRLPVRHRDAIRRSRQPGRHGFPDRQVSRTPSREKMHLHHSVSRSREDDFHFNRPLKREPSNGPSIQLPTSRLCVDVLPIAGFSPASSTVSVSDSENAFTNIPSSSTPSSMKVNNGSFIFSSEISSETGTPELSDSYISLPDLPLASFKPQLGTILSPSYFKSPSLIAQVSDDETSTDGVLMLPPDPEQIKFADGRSEPDEEQHRHSLTHSTIRLLKVSEYVTHEETGEMDLETVEETELSYPQSYTDDTLPPLPVETDEELEQNDISITPRARIITSAHNLTPQILENNVKQTTDFQKQRSPQISLMRITAEKPVDAKRIPQFFNKVSRPEGFWSQKIPTANSSEPGELNNIDIISSPDIIINAVPMENPRSIFSSHSLEGVEGQTMGRINSDRSEGRQRPISDGISPTSVNSRRTSYGNDGESDHEKETPQPDIILNYPFADVVAPGSVEHRGNLCLYFQDFWRPLHGVLTATVLELRVKEQSNRLFGEVPLQLISDVFLEQERDMIFPFSISLTPPFMAGFGGNTFEIASISPGGGSPTLNVKSCKLRFSVNSGTLRDVWFDKIRKYVAILQDGQKPMARRPNEQESIEGIPNVWPPGMLDTMALGFSQFENSADMEAFVHICEASRVPADGRELFRALEYNEQGFVIWRKVRKTLEGIEDSARLGAREELEIFIEKSKHKRLYKQHKDKALVLRGLVPSIRDSEDWLSRIEDAFGEYHAEFFPLTKDLAGDNVELVFADRHAGELFFQEMTNRIKRILIDHPEQRAESLHLDFLTISEFVENYRNNKEYFERGSDLCIE